jgi:hypothetical protein
MTPPCPVCGYPTQDVGGGSLWCNACLALVDCVGVEA